jgi:hypothetical protein
MNIQVVDTHKTIKKMNEKNVKIEEKVFDVFREVQMETVKGEKVMVRQKISSETASSIDEKIKMIEERMAFMSLEKEKWELLLDNIKKNEPSVNK